MTEGPSAPAPTLQRHWDKQLKLKTPATPHPAYTSECTVGEHLKERGQPCALHPDFFCVQSGKPVLFSLKGRCFFPRKLPVSLDKGGLLLSEQNSSWGPRRMLDARSVLRKNSGQGRRDGSEIISPRESLKAELPFLSFLCLFNLAAETIT